MTWNIYFCIDVLELISGHKKSTDPDDLTSKPILHSARSGARTLDTLIKSQVLYQLS